MSLKTSLFVTLTLLFVATGVAQRNFDQNNHIGIFGGVTYFDINTSDFQTEMGTGFNLGFETRGAFYNDFDLIYGVSFQQNKLDIFGRNIAGGGLALRPIEYQVTSAQVKLLGSYNIIHNHLSIEAGPMLNVNGKLKLTNESQENFTLEGYESLTAREIENVSRVHFHVAAGITAGIENVRLSAQYQYGVTNLFSRFNEVEGLERPNGSFTGNTGTIVLMAILYL